VKSSPTLGTLNSYVVFSLKKASRLCKFFSISSIKDTTVFKSFVFITTRKDRLCSLRIDPPSGATRREPPAPKKFVFFFKKRKLSFRSTIPRERPKTQRSRLGEQPHAK
jgi:hypothetical protein